MRSRSRITAYGSTNYDVAFAENGTPASTYTQGVGPNLLSSSFGPPQGSTIAYVNPRVFALMHSRIRSERRKRFLELRQRRDGG